VNQLGVFAKYWLPGAVKTRLACAIGDERASRLYRHFVVTLLRRFRQTGDRRFVVYSPTERVAEFTSVTPQDWELEPQAPGDLGERMQAFFESHLVRPYDRVVLIGTDSPTLPADTIDNAFNALQSQSVVLGPTHDGGYYLVGATGQAPPIFADIDWSTPEVWQQTTERLHRSGQSFMELPMWYDVDDLNDLKRIKDELKHLAQRDPTWTSLADEVQAALAHAS